MAHDSVANPGSGGDTFVTVDLSLATYPTGSGKVPATVLYVSPNTTTAPTPFVSGQKTMANSLGVVIASDQSAVPVTANAGTNLNTSALALDASVNGVIVAQGSTTSGEKGPLIQGAVTTAAPAYTTAQTSPLSLTTGGALRVDASAATVTISGTVTANAGTNLNTSALALDASVNGIIVAQGSTTSGEKGPLIQGAVTTAAPSYTTAQTSPLSLTTGGALRVDASAATVTISGTVTANAGTNLNTSALALDTSVNGLLVAQASTTSGQSGPLVQTATTTAAPTYTTAKTNPLNTTTGGALRSDITTIAGTAPTTAGKLDVKGADGDVFVRQATAANLNATVFVAGTTTSSGLSTKHFVSAASDNATNLKGSAGQLYSVQAFNVNAAVRYLKFYDKATTPTVGTDTVKKVVAIPGNTAGAGVVVNFTTPIPFANGIGYGLVTGIANSDDTSVGANDCVVGIDYV